MDKEYYLKMLDDFLEEESKKPISKFHFLDNNATVIPSFYQNNDLLELENLFASEERPKFTPNLNDSFLLCILNDDLKIAQKSTNFFFDDLDSICNFIKKEKNKNFLKLLSRVYFIDDVRKNKFIEKAKKKNKKTFYDDYTFGINILNYISGEKFGVLGDKYGVQNCILDNITSDDSIDKKFIFVLNFDVELFEIYYSVPFNVYSKGTNLLEDELIYCSYFSEIDKDIIDDIVNNRFENFM